MPLQLTKRRRLEIGWSAVGCRTVKRHKCRAPLTHRRYEAGRLRLAFAGRCREHMRTFYHLI